MEYEQPGNTDENHSHDVELSNNSPSVPSPPSIPVVVTLSDSWPKEDDVTVTRSDEKEAAYNTNPILNSVSSVRKGTERSFPQVPVPAVSFGGDMEYITGSRS